MSSLSFHSTALLFFLPVINPHCVLFCSPRHRAREPEDGLRRRERPGVGDVIGRGAVSHRRLPAEPRPPADLDGGETRRRLATPVTSQQLNITTPMIIPLPVSENGVKSHQLCVSRGSRLSQMEAAILKMQPPAAFHAGPRRTRSRKSTDLPDLQTFSVLFPATVRRCCASVFSAGRYVTGGTARMMRALFCRGFEHYRSQSFASE